MTEKDPELLLKHATIAAGHVDTASDAGCDLFLNTCHSCWHLVIRSWCITGNTGEYSGCDIDGVGVQFK